MLPTRFLATAHNQVVSSSHNFMKLFHFFNISFRKKQTILFIDMPLQFDTGFRFDLIDSFGESGTAEVPYLKSVCLHVEIS